MPWSMSFSSRFHFFCATFSKGGKNRGKNHLPAKRAVDSMGSLPSGFFFQMFFFQVLFGIYIAANPMIDALSWKGDLLRSFTSFTGRLDDGRSVALAESKMPQILMGEYPI